MNSFRRLYPLFLFVLGLFIYSSALEGPFVLDDLLYVVYNPAIREVPAASALSSARLVADMSFALNYLAGGLNPFDYRLTNVFIHVINSILLYLLSREVFGALARRGRGAEGLSAGDEGRVWAASALASVLFLVHPVQTQAVSYIAQRYTSLAALFYLASLFFYLKARAGGMRGRGLLVISFVSALAAQKTKEIAFTLPFAILLFELVLFAGEGWKRRVVRLLPFFLLLALIPASLVTGGGSGADGYMRQMKLADLANLSTYEYMITETRVVATYLKLLVWPSSLHFDYHFPRSASALEPKVLASSVLILGVAFLGVYLIRRPPGEGDTGTRAAGLGAIFFLLALSVESSVIPIKDVIFEHRLYLPSAGAFIAVSSALVYSSRVKRALRGRGLAAAVVIIVMTFSAATVSRNSVWSSDLALYMDEVMKNPAEAPPRNYLAMAYMERGRLGEALDMLESAAEIEPGNAAVHKNLGLLYRKTGELELAKREFMTLKRLRPGYAGASYNLALVYLEMGLTDKAEREFSLISAQVDSGAGEGEREAGR